MLCARSTGAAAAQGQRRDHLRLHTRRGESDVRGGSGAGGELLVVPAQQEAQLEGAPDQQ